MNSLGFDLETYRHRINFSGAIDVSQGTLTRLHYAHFYSIPFENFDILLGRGIDLDPRAVFNKLVLKNRGGYCFELNGLFLQALKLQDRTLTITDNGRKQVHTLPDSPAYLDAVKMHFGIELNASYSDLKPLPLGSRIPPRNLFTCPDNSCILKEVRSQLPENPS